MKTNFRENKDEELKSDVKTTDFIIQGNKVPKKKLTKEEFEESIKKLFQAN